MNALTRLFSAGGAEITPGAGPSIGKSAPPAKAHKKLTDSDVLEIVRVSDFVASQIEGKAAALQERCEHLIESIRQAKEAHKAKTAELVAELHETEAKRIKLEIALRKVSNDEAAIQHQIQSADFALRNTLGLIENGKGIGLERQLEDATAEHTDEALRWIEEQIQETRYHSPPFVMNLPNKGDRVRAGGYDETVQAALNARAAALRAARSEIQEPKVRELPAQDRLAAITRILERIPPIPEGASKMAQSAPNIELPR